MKIHPQSLRDAATAIDKDVNHNLGPLAHRIDNGGGVVEDDPDEMRKVTGSYYTSDLWYTFPEEFDALPRSWGKGSKGNVFYDEYTRVIDQAQGATYYMGSRLESTADGLRSMAKSSETTEGKLAYNVFRYTTGTQKQSDDL